MGSGDTRLQRIGCWERTSLPASHRHNSSVLSCAGLLRGGACGRVLQSTSKSRNDISCCSILWNNRDYEPLVPDREELNDADHKRDRRNGPRRIRLHTSCSLSEQIVALPVA